MAILILDPVTRIEGHLRIDTRVENGKVVDAWCRGEMFRGFESILQGRDPLDAPLITARICGVCPVSHALSACRALESALGLTLPANAGHLRNLILGANFLASHILHFYQLSLLDFVDVGALQNYGGSDPGLLELKAWARNELAHNRILPAAPFLPRLAGDYSRDARWNLHALSNYMQALEMRREAHRMAALFGGRMPHPPALVPGGVTCGVDAAAVEDFRHRLRRVRRFVEEAYLPDVATATRNFPAYAKVGFGVPSFLSFGAFDEGQAGPWLPAGVVRQGRLEVLNPDAIVEEAGAGYYTQAKGLHPSRGETVPAPEKEGAYSWLKAPRYGGAPCETGPLARLLAARLAGPPEVARLSDRFLREVGWGERDLRSTMGRHAARALEAVLLVQRMELWLDQLEPGQPTVGAYRGQRNAQGFGLIEAPRGALGHWLTIESGKLSRYQCAVPSTWNFSPRDDRGMHGPVEVALIGTAVNAEYKGLEVARVVRAFDPCLACAVH